MEIIRATEQDLEELLAFYQRVADEMEGKDIRHWHWGRYPTEEMIREDVEKGQMYVLLTDGAITAAVGVMFGQEEAYDTLPWTCGVRPGSFHRLAVHPAMQGAGLGGLVLDDVQQLLRRSGCDCIRCDTSENNRPALNFYEKMGFRRCGKLHWEENTGDNITFDKALKRETPLWPIPMVPAFRSGADTPWGGNRLHALYGKDAGEQTGESMEVSCIPALESADPMGRKLPSLIREFREKLVGRFVDQPFPLLLKLIDARDRLSVQVHPDDVYAASQEHGKLGKTEAWLILEAPKDGGEIVCGIRPGVSIGDLRSACREGKAVEPLLRRMRVQRGDLCFIPAGCVHSVGPGILLYEIQESSDLTYRFYDWDRVGADGKKRELHLEKALAVTDLRCLPRPVRVERSYGVRRLLNEERFTLDVIHSRGLEVLPPVNEFGLLTCLEGMPELRWTGGGMTLRKGETCLLPKSAPPLAMRGEGYAALSMPNK